MATLWQQQDGGYMLLWKRYGNNKMAAILHHQQYSRRLNLLIFFLSCKANARVNLAKTGHGPHSHKLLCCSVYFCFVSFCVLFVCKYVLYYCHRVSTQLQLINISLYIIIKKPYHTANWIFRNNEQFGISSASQPHSLHQMPLPRLYFPHASRINCVYRCVCVTDCLLSLFQRRFTGRVTSPYLCKMQRAQQIYNLNSEQDALTPCCSWQPDARIIALSGWNLEGWR